MACALALHGIVPHVVEANASTVDESRALAIHARTLELLEGIGLTGRLTTAGHRIRRAHIHHRRTSTIDFEADLDNRTRYPFVLSLGQSDTERIAFERAEQLGVNVEWNTRLIDVEPVVRHGRDVAVQAQIESPTGTRRSRVYEWIIGCDGAGSDVREAVGIPFPIEADDSRHWAVADVRMPPASRSPDFQLHMASSPIGLIPLPAPDAVRVVALRPGSASESGLDLKALAALFSERASHVPPFEDLIWSSQFQPIHGFAQTFRTGRVLLAGDAAHIHSPLGGQGMNLGIQDAIGLAWKLAFVVKGLAPEWWLDTYEDERRPIAASVIAATGRGTQVIASSSVFVASLRGVATRALVSWDQARRSAVERLAMLHTSLSDGHMIELGMHHSGPSRLRGRPWVGDLLPGVELPGGEWSHDLIDPKCHTALVPASNEAAVRAATGLDTTGSRLVVRPISFDDARSLVESLDMDRTESIVVRPDGHIAFRGIDPEPWFVGVFS